MRVLQDIPRIYTGIAEWGSCFLYLLIFPRRLKGAAFAVSSVVALIVQCAFLTFTARVPIVFWIPCMIAAFLLMYSYILLVSGYTRSKVLYATFHAFILAEFTASLEWQMEWFFLIRPDLPEIPGTDIRSLIQSFLFMLVFYTVIFALFGRLQKAAMAGQEYAEYSTQEVGAAGIIALLTFAISNLSFVTVNTPFSAGIEQDIFLMRTLIDLGGLSILYAYQTRINELKKEQELSAVTAMLKSQYESYRNYQDTIEIINLKYHDLKHQLVALRTASDPEERSGYIDAMESELEQYRPEKQTGNHVLDAIIAGKSVRGRNSGIQFTCVADGKLLDFLHVTDICTIFGNALDNAIESTSLVQDPEKRLVHLQLSAKKGFVFIRISNYCENELIPEGTDLRTTKPDPVNHGNGIRSMRYAVQKYGGMLTYGMEDHQFILKILIPMPEEKIRESTG